MELLLMTNICPMTGTIRNNTRQGVDATVLNGRFWCLKSRRPILLGPSAVASYGTDRVENALLKLGNAWEDNSLVFGSQSVLL